MTKVNIPNIILQLALTTDSEDTAKTIIKPVPFAAFMQHGLHFNAHQLFVYNVDVYATDYMSYCCQQLRNQEEFLNGGTVIIFCKIWKVNNALEAVALDNSIILVPNKGGLHKLIMQYAWALDEINPEEQALILANELDIMHRGIQKLCSLGSKHQYLPN